MDIMFINGMPILTTINKTLRFRGLVPLNNRFAEELYRGLNVVMRHYNSAGYEIEWIDCDREFKSVMDEIKDKLDNNINYMAINAHIPEAEHNNRTIAERVRMAYHNLPYKTMSKVMLKDLAMVVTKQLNIFPAKDRVSPYFSLCILLGGNL